MLEIFKRDEFNGKLKNIKEFNSFEELFAAVWYHTDFAESFGYTDVDRNNSGRPFGDHHKATDWCAWKETKFVYVIYDNGKFVTPDRLVGLFRDWKWTRRNLWIASWTRKYDCGHKKGAYGWIRHMHTTQEKRWANAYDDEEFAPKYRASRCGHNLPSTWDDYWAGNQKCWKRQSKRPHQWKEKMK